MTILNLPELAGASTLSEQLYAVLEESIITGALSPGQRLHADDLAQHFGVSRIPIRETLRALNANGWVELIPRRGAYVRRASDHELSDLFEVRLLLECEGARRAADRRTEPQLAALGDLVAAGRRAAADGDEAEVTRINTEFHAQFVACAANAVLADLLELLSKRVRFYFSTAVTVRAAESVEEHASLVQALRVGDGNHAAALIRQHIEATRDAVASRLEGAVSPPPSRRRP